MELTEIANEGDEMFLMTQDSVSIQNINGRDKLHPTEKPVELLSNYICNSSVIGDTVFDPFMGSGSTAIACINTNRNYIGFELDKQYCEMANERIRKALTEKAVGE